MPYKILADGVVLVHFLWILFLVFGALPGARYKAVRMLHLSGLAFALVIQVFDWYCPLTYLEGWLRARHDPALAYSGSYIVHYVEKIIYLRLSRPVIFLSSLLLCCANVWWYLRRRTAHGTSSGQNSR